jgi:hypothetical protein
MLLNLLVLGTYSERHVSVDHQFGSLKSGPLLLEDEARTKTRKVAVVGRKADHVTVTSFGLAYRPCIHFSATLCRNDPPVDLISEAP